MKSDQSHSESPLPLLLLVDDNQEVREQMSWGLKSFYRLVEADTRVAASDILRGEKISLVTLDLGLPPDADGVSEGLKALEEFLVINPLCKGSCHHRQSRSH